MEFNDFSQQLALWCEHSSERPLDCWIDDVPLQFFRIESGVRCSIELLDRADSADPRRLEASLKLGGASLACDCPAAVAQDPQTRCVNLVRWLPEPFDEHSLLDCAAQLINQRGALLSLLETPQAPRANAVMPGTLPTSLSAWQRNILDA